MSKMTLKKDLTFVETVCIIHLDMKQVSEQFRLRSEVTKGGSPAIHTNYSWTLAGDRM